MKREIIITGDGSHSIAVPEWKVAYHSVYGAIQESLHVFIDAGLSHLLGTAAPGQVTIFEMGFGTGLNALLSLMESQKKGVKIFYEAVELFPLNSHETEMLNYCQILDRPDLQNLFIRMHDCDWEKEISITEHFILYKSKTNLLNYESGVPKKLVFFDAFAPAAQPELWTKEVFDKMYFLLKPGGILVTYCSKGDVRRSMIAAGFAVEKLHGPPQKREMLRAIKKI